MQQQSLPPPSLTQKAPFQFPPPVQSNPPRMFGGWCVARQVALALLCGAVLSGSSVLDAQGQGMIFEPSIIDTTSFVEVVLRLGSARCASARLSLSLLSLSLYLSLSLSLLSLSVSLSSLALLLCFHSSEAHSGISTLTVFSQHSGSSRVVQQ